MENEIIRNLQNEKAEEWLKISNDLMKVEQGQKFDQDKPDYNLIPPNALLQIAKVLTYGAKKYSPNNWKLVVPHDRYMSAAFRHIEAFRNGEDIDEESGNYHLDHAIVSLIMLRELKYNNK